MPKKAKRSKVTKNNITQKQSVKININTGKQSAKSTKRRKRNPKNPNAVSGSNYPVGSGYSGTQLISQSQPARTNDYLLQNILQNQNKLLEMPNNNNNNSNETKLLHDRVKGVERDAYNTKMLLYNAVNQTNDLFGNYYHTNYQTPHHKVEEVDDISISRVVPRQSLFGTPKRTEPSIENKSSLDDIGTPYQSEALEYVEDNSSVPQQNYLDDNQPVDISIDSTPALIAESPKRSAEKHRSPLKSREPVFHAPKIHLPSIDEDEIAPSVALSHESKLLKEAKPKKQSKKKEVILYEPIGNGTYEMIMTGIDKGTVRNKKTRTMNPSRSYLIRHGGLTSEELDDLGYKH